MAIARAVALLRARQLSISGEGKRIREEAGISQATVATDIGTCPASISHWENANRKPSGDSAIRWLELCDQLKRLGGSK